MAYTNLGDYNQLGATNTNDAQKVKEAHDKFSELRGVQQKVDAALAKMPPGPAKDRLMKLRAENRGFFSSTILPAWEKFQSLVKSTSGVGEWLSSSASSAYSSAKNFVSSIFGEEEEGMGFLPLIPFALAAASTALVGYVGKSIYVEYKILNDPALTSSERVKALSSGGLASIGNTLDSARKAAIVGAVLFIGWKIYQARKLAGSR